MGMAYRLVRPQPTYQDVFAVKNSKTMRFTTSPFGVTPEQYEKNPPLYLGKAVAWKMYEGKPPKGSKLGVTRALENAILAGCSPAGGASMIAGLKRAIDISKKYAGVRGTVLYNGKLYPKKCIEQMREKK